MENEDPGDGVREQYTVPPQESDDLIRSWHPLQDENTSAIDTSRVSKSLTFMNGLALVVGLQIGSGIFSSPAVVSSHVPSPLAAILVWIFAGLLVWTGASTLGELGCAIPQNGGIQEYLCQCYGDFPSCLFAWTWLLIAKPCANAMASFILAEHLSRAVWGTEGNSDWANTVIALLSVTLITFINCLGASSGARAANAFLVIKLFAIVSIGVVGLSFGLLQLNLQRGVAIAARQDIKHTGLPIANATGGPEQLIPKMDFGSYVTALFGALFAYGGWENIGFIAAELESPRSNIPRVINTAMTIVIACFALANISLYIVLPMDVLGETNTVAVEFGTRIFGRTGGVLYSVLVSLSCLGALNANIFATGRLTYEAGKRHYFPKTLGRPWRAVRLESKPSVPSNPNGGSLLSCRINLVYGWLLKAIALENGNKDNPVYAMIFNAFISGIYIILGTFRGLVTFKGVTEYAIYTITCTCAFILRSRKARAFSSPSSRSPTPNKPSQSYQSYTLNPVIFSCVGAVLVVRGIISEPMIGMGITFIVVIGRVFYSAAKLGRVM